MNRNSAMDSIVQNIKYKGHKIGKKDREDIFPTNYELKDFSRKGPSSSDSNDSNDSDCDESESDESESDDSEKYSDDSESHEPNEMDNIALALEELERNDTGAIKIMSATASDELEIGRGVKQQKEIYDQLLHLRINLQKPLVASYACFNGGKGAKEDVWKNKNVSPLMKAFAGETVKEVLRDLLGLTRTLAPADATTTSRKRKSDEGERVAGGGYWKKLKKYNESLLPRLNSVLDEWNGKVQIQASISSGSSRKLKVINQASSSILIPFHSIPFILQLIIEYDKANPKQSAGNAPYAEADHDCAWKAAAKEAAGRRC